jgi:surfactin synthase thioesterase subunit
MLGGQPTGKLVTTRFVWEGFRLLQEVHGDVPLTCVYSDQDSYVRWRVLMAWMHRRSSGSTASPTVRRSG